MRFFMILAALVLAFPASARAEDVLSYYFFMPDEDGYEAEIETELYFGGDFNADEKAYMLFANFFSDERRYCVPKGVRVLDAKISGGMLILNVSGDILYYGGTYYERVMVMQLLMTALNIPDVNSLTLLICGESRPLSEGGKTRLLTLESLFDLWDIEIAY